MYFQGLGLLFVIGVAVGQTLNCLDRSDVECGENPMKDMPTTAEELKTACKAKQVYVKCKADFYGTCDTTVRKAPMEYRYLENLKKGCDENSENYAVISRNMGCIASNFNEAKEICNSPAVERVIENFFRNLSTALLGGREEETAYCSISLPVQTCGSIAIAKLCGPELENPAVEMIRNISPIFSYLCPEDIFGRIEPHLGALKETLKATINARK